MMTRTSTWANLGTNFNTTDFNSVLTEASLDYEVKSQKLFTTVNGENITVPKKAAIVREDGYVYGVVSESYRPVQNKDAFDFINYIDEDITFKKAGETTSGLVYVIGELPEVNILGDTFIPHVIFQNSHNGLFSLATSICPLRIVCQNQFNLAFKESNSTFIIKHTKNVESKMAVAADTLKNVSNYMRLFTEKAEEFATQKLSESQVTSFINFMFPIKENMTDKAIEKLEDEKRTFIKAYNNEDNRNFIGSAWGLINGLTDYITHKEYKRKVEFADEKRFVDTILVGNTLNTSMEYLTAMTAI